MPGQYLDPVAIRNQARERFISTRAVEEQKFNKWYAALLKCPEDKVLSRIPFDYKDMSMQTLVPEWYAEIPDKAVCEQQVAAANEKINIVNGIIDSINREGLELLNEYNELYSR
jgi:hypothetical protein